MAGARGSFCVLDHPPPGVGVQPGTSVSFSKALRRGQPETAIGYVRAFSRFLN